MSSFALHPRVYATGQEPGLVRMLERAWVRDHTPGRGSFFIVSGFGNYNGGVRFLEIFREHVANGGRIVSFFAGSPANRLTSVQLVEALLSVGAEVHLVNRKHLLHAKCYGSSTADGEQLIVSSGNFTGNGMGLNVEASCFVDADASRNMGFSWGSLVESLQRQAWEFYQPSLEQRESPAWRLLYDEHARDLVLDESERMTLLVTLGHADTARIQAQRGSAAGLGTQYFWLSRDCYGFFPPLTIRNRRGDKTTYSCLIRMYHVQLGLHDDNCRVTFEAENNLDFRLGTGPLRHTRCAGPGDLAAISRVGERDYELRILRRQTRHYNQLRPYAIHFIGHRRKQYGYVDNEVFSRMLGLRLPAARRPRV